MSPRRWAFISDHRADFGVKRICRVLGASRVGYYRHLATEQARAGPGDARLHRGRPEHQVVRRHHLHSRRPDLALPRHGDRHLLEEGRGWSIADHMRTSLVTDAIEMAVAARGGRVSGVVFHTDRGAQYSAAAFAEVCRRHGIRRSMGRVGSSYDNALAESFFPLAVLLQPAPSPLRARLPHAVQSMTANPGQDGEEAEGSTSDTRPGVCRSPLQGA